ncbi:hypothetical protein IVA89_36130 [Bradyrhizobium sp. 150]|nr:hypothetical protein [Bradyrhizobium sp. 150]
MSANRSATSAEKTSILHPRERKISATSSVNRLFPWPPMADKMTMKYQAGISCFSSVGEQLNKAWLDEQGPHEPYVETVVDCRHPSEIDINRLRTPGSAYGRSAGAQAFARVRRNRKVVPALAAAARSRVGTGIPVARAFGVLLTPPAGEADVASNGLEEPPSSAT